MNYKSIVWKLFHEGKQSSPRGKPVMELLNVKLQFDPCQHFMVHELLPLNTDYIMREIDWYIKGDPYDLTIVEHAPIWKEHVQDGRLESNYGYWLKSTLPRAIHALMDEQDTRRAVAYIGNESSFLSGRLDVPCTNMMQFIIREQVLNAIVTMRSQDVYFGLRNDLAAFQFFAETVAHVTHTPLRNLWINVGSLHAYDEKIGILQTLLLDNRPVNYGFINFDEKIKRIIKEWRL